ncbi:hypothetical protein [Pedobacter sp. SG918]|nr:hypothetical protein [Pedobacter sp. SG918]NII81230.1 hypothetical protein [Pedobacter sp. SG908]NMN35237.1 hypothetical protein [Pedobacter sp. SG918]
MEPYKKNYKLTQEEVNGGEVLKIVASAVPVKILATENWISSLGK